MSPAVSYARDDSTDGSSGKRSHVTRTVRLWTGSERLICCSVQMEQRTRTETDALLPRRAATLLDEQRLIPAVRDGAVVLVDNVWLRTMTRRRTKPKLCVRSAGLWRSFCVLVRSPVRSAVVTGAIRSTDGVYPVPVSRSTSSWLVDANVFWAFLSGRLGGADDALTGQRYRPVEVESVTGEAIAPAARAGQLWVCRAEWLTSAEDGSSRVGCSWLVRSGENGDKPGRELARSLHRLREGLRGVGLDDPRVGITRQERAEVDRDRRLVRLTTESWDAFWPAASVQRMREAIGSADLPAEVAVLAAELRYNGLVSLAYRIPRTPEEQRAGYALRTIGAFLENGGRALDSFVDSTYRSRRRFLAFLVLYRWIGPARRARIDRVLGQRRREQIPLRPEPVGSPNGGSQQETWRTLAVATDELVREYAVATRARGMGLDAASMDILQRYFMKPRGDAMRRVWDRNRRTPEITRMLEEGMLSTLRRLGRAVPRSVLVEAVAGRDETSKRRVAAIFSRNGRQIFLEDVTALEAAIDRGAFTEWDRLLAAHQRLRAIARRMWPEEHRAMR